MKRLIPIICLALAACAAQPAKYVQPAASDLRNRAAVHTELGAGYFARGQNDVALHELNEAISLDPGYAFAYNIMGLVYMALHEDEVAEQNFDRALRLSPADAEINNNYGWFLCQTNREAKSIKHFQVALENPLYSTPELANLNAGICSQKLNDEQGAERYFLAAVKIKPTLGGALYGLAELYYHQGRLQPARAFLQRYLQAANPSAKSLWLGVRIEHKLGGREAEATYATLLNNRFPESNETHELNNGKFD